MKSQGVFIAFEGPDGAGTTTQIEYLKQFLMNAGLDCETFRQPSGGEIGQYLRQCLSGRVRFHSERHRDWVMGLLFAADRLCQSDQEIRPIIEGGTWALCDRYTLSSLVYQGADGLEDDIRQLNRFAPEPDILFYLDVPPEVALARVNARGQSKEIFETKDAIEQQVKRYRALIKTLPAARVHRLDGQKSIEAIHQEVCGAIQPFLERQ